MDSHQPFRYGANSKDVSFDLLHSTSSRIPEWMVGTLKFNLGEFPYSPVSTLLDCETFSTVSNVQDQYNSAGTLLGVGSFHNSPLEINSSFHQVSLSVDHHQDQLGICSSADILSQDANIGQIVKNGVEKLETALMDPNTDEEKATTSNVALEDNQQPQFQSQKSCTENQESSQGSHVIQPQSSLASKYQKSIHGVHIEKRHRANEESSQEVPRVDLKQMLIKCAEALSENRMNDFEKLIQEAQTAVSISGDPIQRLGTYMVEGLVARKEASGTKIYRALRCNEPESKDLLSYMQILYEIGPYFKFGYMAANGAIAEAFRNEDRIHIIDFQIAQGTQWVTLIQAFAARPSGPPHVRITGIDDPVSEYARGGGLEVVGERLAAMSKKFNIPIDFHPVPVFAAEVTREMLDVKPGEALAVNFALQLHHIPDESVDVNNPRDEILRTVKSLSPKVVTLVEQEANTNTSPFFIRFKETLDYYSAMFESIDTVLPRYSKDRINVEQHCLAKDIVNIIACEGKERVERHELLGKWKARFSMAGFQPYPLSCHVNSVIKDLLRSYSEHYTLLEKDGTMLLGWKGRNLISASAWQGDRKTV